MDIPVWKKLSGVALMAALLVGSVTDTALAKSRSRRKAKEAAAAQEQSAEQPTQPQQPPALPAASEQPQQQAVPAQSSATPYGGVVPAAAAPAPGVPQSVVQTSSAQPTPAQPMPAQPTGYSYPNGGNSSYPAGGNYVQEGGETYCEGDPQMGFCDRLRGCDARFKCWKMNHCPCFCCGCFGCNCGGASMKNLRNSWLYTHKGMYPADPNYFDTRDIQVHSAQWSGVPTSVPLAPVVRYSYNDGWGVPASRITTIGSTYNRWYPQEWYGFEQQRRPAPVGPNGRPLASQSPAPIYWPTDTTQRGEYYKHVPQWQPAQRTRWSNIPNVVGVPAPSNPTVNLTPYTPINQGHAPQARPIPVAPQTPPEA